MLRAWLHQLWGLGFSCALRLLQVVQSHLVLRLRLLLERVVLLLLPLLCPACQAISSVRRLLAPVGVVVARPAMGPTGVRRSVQGVIVRRSTIGLPRALLRKIEPMLLLPELDVRLGVLLAIFVPLQQMTARHVLDLRVGLRGRLQERSTFDQALVIDPLLLRERQMTTGRVPLRRLTLTGMTRSGQSWASSGALMAWKSLQVSHHLDARLLLLRSKG